MPAGRLPCTQANKLSSKSEMTTITQALSGDVDNVLDVLNDACRHLRSKKIEQWPDCFARGFVDDRIRQGEFYTVSIDNSVVAAFRLIWSDLATWGCDDEQAGYVHTLAVHRKARGQNLGASAIAWASEKAAMRGRRYLRLDCISTNDFLADYYSKLGFSLIREAKVGGVSVQLFQKEL